MERTFVIFKPDAMEKKVVGTVLARFEEAGFEVVAAKMVQLDSAILRTHYAHIADKPFFPEVESFMGSRPVVMMVLQGDGIIDKVRALLGPTDSAAADKGTIRGDFGTDKMKNICHASDSPETAAAEVKRFFADNEVYS